MNALDELIADYVDYWNACHDEGTHAFGFAAWCRTPVKCDQELLAESGLAVLVFGEEADD